MNMTEKILAEAAGLREVTPGEIIEAGVDLAMTHDGTSPPTIRTFRDIASRGGPGRVWDPERIVMVFDHNVPPNTIGAAEFQKVTREFAREQGIVNIFQNAAGICHQVLPEKGFLRPGMVIVGADSHTCTYGAFGAFATGMGATDMAMVFATGRTWFMVPEAMRMEVTGKLRGHVYAKDVILHIIGEIGVDGATYRSVEFTGDTIESMDVAGRMTICNMAVEMGAKNGIMEPNRETLDYLRARTGRDFRVYSSDEDSQYIEDHQFDVSDLEPQVACPDDVDNVCPVHRVQGTHIDEAFLGSCTNGRYEDLKIAAEVIGDRKVHEDVRFIVSPASREIYLRALEDGIIETFIRAGAIVCNPGCGPCLGAHMGVLAPGEVSIATTNRNFRGRMGDPSSSVYLANPAVVAESAIEGVISAPEQEAGNGC
ncbi:3-isopropylmalate dehydratase large subunit [Methanothermobacter thermautotrophicus]|uniref:3-isopropylmalate dehydratase large subunit n=1 Tax=Methanothermobacter thermautotrophicus TaxID=145262 RepID=A0A842YLG3_METTF|nr:homoaconitase large subunit [Methanothermobacter thermautotrophicus]MBE2899807.1 3-isopropylmalate dehydratase large subunit [Methanothermobacter thermautotrophicus]